MAIRRFKRVRRKNVLLITGKQVSEVAVTLFFMSLLDFDPSSAVQWHTLVLNDYDFLGSHHGDQSLDW